MIPGPSTVRVLLLTLVDYLTAGLLYRLVSPVMGVLVGVTGTLLLCSLVYQFTQRPSGPNDAEALP